MEKVLVSIFRSSKKEEMYVYLLKDSPLDELPEALMQRFGKPVHVMDILLDENRKLARADTAEVLEKIQEQGFYLQMPPSAVDLANNDFLDRNQ